MVHDASDAIARNLVIGNNVARPVISGDGAWVAFDSRSQNLDPDDTEFADDVFVVEVDSGAVERVSIPVSGIELPDADSRDASISEDGRFVAFNNGQFRSMCTVGFEHQPDLDAGVLTQSFRDAVATACDRFNTVISDSATVTVVQPADMWLISDGIDGYIVEAVPTFGGGFLLSVRGIINDFGGLTTVFVHDRTTGVTVPLADLPTIDQIVGEDKDPVISNDGQWVVFGSPNDLLAQGTAGAPAVGGGGSTRGGVALDDTDLYVAFVVPAVLGDINGFVFRDLDHDGMLDPGEPGVADWPVHLAGVGGDRTASPPMTVTTDGSGLYRFTNIIADRDYEVTIGQQPGMRQSHPTLGDPDPGPGFYTVELASGGAMGAILVNGLDPAERAEFGLFFQPDLVVSDLASPAAVFGQPTQIEWSVANEGLGAPPLGVAWPEQVWLTDDGAVDGLGFELLMHEESFNSVRSRARSITMPALGDPASTNGTGVVTPQMVQTGLTVVVRVDPPVSGEDVVDEGDQGELNNDRSTPIGAELPDLVVSDFSRPDLAFNMLLGELGYSVRNAGNVAIGATRTWTEQLWIGTDVNVHEPDDLPNGVWHRQVAVNPRSGPLDPGQVVAHTLEPDLTGITLPSEISADAVKWVVLLDWPTDTPGAVAPIDASPADVLESHEAPIEGGPDITDPQVLRRNAFSYRAAGECELIDHARLETWAKGTAYEDLEKGESPPHGYDYGYIVDEVFDVATGFYAVGLVCEGHTPTLAIRGTQGGADLRDIWDDLNTQGIGFAQFHSARGPVIDWLSRVAVDYAPAHITGHSLGGALSQLMASSHTGAGGQLGEIVTFNAPGTSQSMADQFVSALTTGVTHYIVTGDVVSMAGEAFLPGAVRFHAYPSLNLFAKHTISALNPGPIVRTGGDYPLPAGLTMTAQASANWLNSTYFTYLDPYYWGALIGLYLVAPGDLDEIPSALMFRGTTEAARQEIGQHLYTLTLPNQMPTQTELEVPKRQFEIFGLDIEVENLMARFVDAPQSIIIQGTVRIPTIFNLTADLSSGVFGQNNFLQITFADEGAVLDVVGEASVENIDFGALAQVAGFGHLSKWAGLKINEAKLFIDTINDEFKIEGNVKLPFVPVSIIGGAGLLDGELNFITIGLDDLSIPIIKPPSKLRRIQLTLDNLASGSIEPLTVGGGITITDPLEAPLDSISIPAPASLGGPYNGRLIDVDLDGIVDPHRFKGVATAKVIGSLITAQGMLEVNWHEGFVEAGYQFNGLGEVLTGSGSLRIDSGFNISARQGVAFSVPDDFFSFPASLLGLNGETIAGADSMLRFLNDGNLSNDFIAAWGTLLGVTGGLKLSFDGDLDLLLGADEVAAKTSARAASRGPAVPDAFEVYTIDPGTSWILLGAEWANPTASVGIEIVTPGGAVLTEAQIAADPSMQIVEDGVPPVAKGVRITAPAAGDWEIRVPDATGLGAVQFAALGANAAPSITLTDPAQDGAPVSDLVTIAFNALDADSDARIDLYYDNDLSDHDGVLITEGLLEADGAGQHQWDTSTVPAGAYYVYAVIDDAQNPPVFSDYATGRVTIVDPAAPAQVTGVQAQRVVGDDVRVSWSAVPGADFYLVRYTADAAGAFYEQSIASDGAATEVVVTDLVPGETYRFVVEAVSAAELPDETVDLRFAARSEPVVAIAGPTATLGPQGDEWDVFAVPGTTYTETISMQSGDVLSAVALPTGATLDAQAGEFEWQVPADATGWHDVVIHRTRADGGVEQIRRRVVADAAFTGDVGGVVFTDLNDDGAVNPGEPRLAGRSVYIDLNENGTLDTTATFDAVAPVVIPDDGTATGEIVVSGLAGTIADVEVTLDIVHANVQDLDVVLVSPAGSRVALFAAVGGAGDDFIGTTFDDEAAAGIGQGAAPFTGRFRPVEAFSLLDGTNANGTWALEITDSATGEIGTLTDWSLQLEMTSPVEPVDVTDAAGAYAFTGVSPGEYLLRQVVPAEEMQVAPAGDAPHALSLVGGDSLMLDFGNRKRRGDVIGAKWDDRNGDGVRDVDEPGLPGVTIYADLNDSRTRDQVTTTIASSNAPVTITDESTTVSTLVVQDVAGTVADVQVTLDVAHAYTPDLDVFLRGPDGGRVLLFSDLGDLATTGFDVTLDDGAGVSIIQASAPFTGTLRPQFPLALVAGGDPNGVWALEVVDDTAGSVGTIQSWSLRLVLDEPSAVTFADDPSTEGVDEAGAYLLSDLPAGAYTIAEIAPPGWIATHPDPVTAGAVHQVDLALGQDALDVDFGNFLLPLAEVSIRGSAWSAAFLTELQNAGLGVDGYAVSSASHWPQSYLPWAEIDQVVARFTADASLLRADHVSVTGTTISQFSYDAGAMTATWTLAAPMATGAATVGLAGAAYPASVVVGDVDRDGATTIFDIRPMRDAADTQPGAGAYSIFADLDGDADVDDQDRVPLGANLGRGLTGGAALAGGSPAITLTGDDRVIMTPQSGAVAGSVDIVLDTSDNAPVDLLNYAVRVRLDGPSAGTDVALSGGGDALQSPGATGLVGNADRLPEEHYVGSANFTTAPVTVDDRDGLARADYLVQPGALGVYTFRIVTGQVGDTALIADDANTTSPFDVLSPRLIVTIPGDFDGDFTVGANDLQIVLSRFTQQVTPGDLSQGDATGDGVVGTGDLQLLLSRFTDSVTPPARGAGTATGGEVAGAASALTQWHGWSEMRRLIEARRESLWRPEAGSDEDQDLFDRWRL